MPEMIPVGNTGIQPDPLGSLSKMIAAKSGMIGLQQQQQNLQTGQYTQASAQATAQQDQQKNAELQALAKFTSGAAGNPAYLNDDGSPNTMKFQQDAMKVAPVYGADQIGRWTSNFKEGTESRRALQSLTGEQNAALGNAFKGVASLGAKATPTDLLNMVEQQRSNNKDPGFNRALDMALLGVDRNDIAGSAGRAAAFVGSQPNAPSTIDTGGQIQPGATGPSGAFTPAGPAINKTLAPQVISAPLTGAPTQVGGGAGTAGRPVTGPGMQPYAGQQADIKDFQNEVGNIRSNADQAPLARNINQQILGLSKDAKTGPGSETWQHVIGAVGATFGLSPSASYQEVGKFLEKNAINNMQSMGGPPSDARLSAAAAANGSTQFSPEALQAVTKFNDATTTGLMQYRQGIDHTVGMGQNVDYTKLPAYKAAWAKNFDVNVFRVENAIRDHDGTELSKIKTELGPKGLQELAQKRQNLNALTQGQIPQ